MREAIVKVKKTSNPQVPTVKEVEGKRKIQESESSDLENLGEKKKKNVSSKHGNAFAVENDNSKPWKCIRGVADSRGLLRHRCYLSGFNRVLELCHTLPPTIMDILCLTPFYHFFEEICDFTINYYHLANLVGHYCGDYLFQLNDKRVQLTARDVGHILGIPDIGWKNDVFEKGEASFSNPF